MSGNREKISSLINNYFLSLPPAAWPSRAEALGSELLKPCYSFCDRPTAMAAAASVPACVPSDRLGSLRELPGSCSGPGPLLLVKV